MMCCKVLLGCGPIKNSGCHRLQAWAHMPGEYLAKLLYTGDIIQSVLHTVSHWSAAALTPPGGFNVWGVSVREKVKLAMTDRSQYTHWGCIGADSQCPCWSQSVITLGDDNSVLSVFNMYLFQSYHHIWSHWIKWESTLEESIWKTTSPRSDISLTRFCITSSNTHLSVICADSKTRTLLVQERPAKQQRREERGLETERDNNSWRHVIM